MYPRHPGVAHVDGCLTMDPGEEIEICFLAHFHHSNGSGSAVGSFSLQVKPKASRPGFRPFDGVSLAGDGGVKRPVAVNSHSNPDVPLLNLHRETALFPSFAEFCCQTRWESAPVAARGNAAPWRMRDNIFSAFHHAQLKFV